MLYNTSLHGPSYLFPVLILIYLEELLYIFFKCSESSQNEIQK